MECHVVSIGSRVQARNLVNQLALTWDDGDASALARTALKGAGVILLVAAGANRTDGVPNAALLVDEAHSLAGATATAAAVAAAADTADIAIAL
jgi:hypothetical protein